MKIGKTFRYKISDTQQLVFVGNSPVRAINEEIDRAIAMVLLRSWDFQTLFLFSSGFYNENSNSVDLWEVSQTTSKILSFMLAIWKLLEIVKYWINIFKFSLKLEKTNIKEKNVYKEIEKEITEETSKK